MSYDQYLKDRKLEKRNNSKKLSKRKDREYTHELDYSVLDDLHKNSSHFECEEKIEKEEEESVVYTSTCILCDLDYGAVKNRDEHLRKSEWGTICKYCDEEIDEFIQNDESPVNFHGYTQGNTMTTEREVYVYTKAGKCIKVA